MDEEMGGFWMKIISVIIGVLSILKSGRNSSQFVRSKHVRDNVTQALP